MGRWPAIPAVAGGRALALTLALLGGAQSIPVPAGAAAISFNSALPVAQQNFVWRQILFRREAGLDRPRAGVVADGTTTVVGYGATSRLALFADLSWFRDRSLRLRVPGRDPERDARGIGDLGLTARYTLWQRNRPGETIRVAPFVRLEAPTGDSGGRDRFGRRPPLLSPGSGGWDASAGAIGTWQTLGHQFDVEIGWRRNGSDDGFRFGEEFAVNASWQQRVFPRQLGRGTGAFTYAVLESRFSDAGKDERHGTNISGTGGQRWLIGPGLQYVTRRWIAEVVVLLPAWQDVGERVPEDDFRVLAGWRINF